MENKKFKKEVSLMTKDFKFITVDVSHLSDTTILKDIFYDKCCSGNFSKSVWINGKLLSINLFFHNGKIYLKDYRNMMRTAIEHDFR